MPSDGGGTRYKIDGGFEMQFWVIYRGRGLRTPDGMLPKQVRDQTALCPVAGDNTDYFYPRQIIY